MSVVRSLDSQQEDVSLVERCIARDAGSLSTLYDQVTTSLRWQIHRGMVPNPRQDVEDLLQDVFMTVLTALPTFRSESALRTWLNRVVTHAAINYMRRRRTRARFQSFQQVHPGRMPHVAADEVRRDLDRVMQVLEDTLPREQFEVMRLDMRGHSAAEIAQKLGLRASTVTSRLKHARDRCRANPTIGEVLRGRRAASEK